MHAKQTKPPNAGTLKFALKVQDCNIEVSAKLPGGPVRPQVLLPVLQSLSNSMSDIAVHRAAQLGEHLSCREGCGACCRQAVPITPVEARMLSEWLDEQPEQKRADLRERLRQAAARLEESGIAQSMREASRSPGREEMHTSGLKYFALGIPCPFLEDERCTIHEIRPMRCREYLVVSPAEHCAHPETKSIVGIKPPVLLSQVLQKWNPGGEPESSEIILLTMLDEWAAHHPPDLDHVQRTAPELLQEFLHAFAVDSTAADGT